MNFVKEWLLLKPCTAPLTLSAGFTAPSAAREENPILKVCFILNIQPLITLIPREVLDGKFI